ncbi:EFhand protein NUCB1 [Caligus rogercresseyi]|uniref:EFhand protein NUCB1 n=1 Tax=Caligus rogercresseyi TaxID=217165 RepID=A0A7T8KJQ0_CALRO|nr:EFhand protein NUCB1 [Caligus rogercresseyi]
MESMAIRGMLWGLLSLCLVFVAARPPVKSESEHPVPNVNVSDVELGLEYNRYLQEVVQILESDPDFRKKWSPWTRIRSGW